MKNLISVILSNVGLGVIIFAMFLKAFSAGLLGSAVHYYNFVLPEPLRIISVFVFPGYIFVSFWLWRDILPVGIAGYKKDLAKFLESRK